MRMGQFSRRSFVKSMLAAGSAPMLFNGCATGFLACRKINIGVVGFGRIAHSMDVPATIRFTDRCRFTAVCDLDAKRRAYGAKFIRDWYAENRGETAEVREYADYREMFADPSIDAVMLCVPDHWHAILATSAILAGKHIWLQKPFTQTIEEGRIVVDLAKRHNTVVQVGSWQRSVMQFARVCELVRNGRIGEVKRVEVGVAYDGEGGSSAAQPVPSTFDYEQWLGPTPGPEVTPYNETRCHAQDLAKIDTRPGWIQLEPYGWGMITNWGAHHLDIAQWGLGMDNSGPEGVSGTAKWLKGDAGRLWNVHAEHDLQFSYNGGRTDLHVHSDFPMGIKFIGEKGDWLYCMRGAAVTASDPKSSTGGKMQPLMASDVKLLEPIRNPEVKLNTSDDHWLNWLEGIAREDPSYTVTNAEEAQRSSTVCCLGHMCMALARGKEKGASVNWNAATEKSTTPGVAEMMKPFRRGRYNLDAAVAALKG